MNPAFLYTLLIVIICGIAGGQILFKQAANALKTYESFFYVFLNPSFIAALAVYGTATLGWIWILQHMQLSKAYPFFALSFVFVPLLSLIFFKEALSWQYMAGVALICAGILVVVMEKA